MKTSSIAAGAAAFIALFALSSSPASAQETQQPQQQAKRDQQQVQADTSCVPRQHAMHDTTAMKHKDTSAVGTAKQPCPNQSQSGVVDSSGKSTLGPGVSQAKPDQNAPVTSKGDTLRKPPSTASPN